MLLLLLIVHALQPVKLSTSSFSLLNEEQHPPPTKAAPEACKHGLFEIFLSLFSPIVRASNCTTISHLNPILRGPSGHSHLCSSKSGNQLNESTEREREKVTFTIELEQRARVQVLDARECLSLIHEAIDWWW